MLRKTQDLEIYRGCWAPGKKTSGGKESLPLSPVLTWLLPLSTSFQEQIQKDTKEREKSTGEIWLHYWQIENTPPPDPKLTRSKEERKERNPFFPTITIWKISIVQYFQGSHHISIMFSGIWLTETSWKFLLFRFFLLSEENNIRI